MAKDNRINWGRAVAVTQLGADVRKKVKTVKQWESAGFVPLPEAEGRMLYPNPYAGKKLYYHESEVRKATPEEKKAASAEAKRTRDENRERRRAEALRKRKAEDYRNDCYRQTIGQTYTREHVRTIVLDTETTGLDSSIDEILQLSIIDADTGETLFNEYFKPYVPDSWPEAEKVNHITPKMVARKPLFMERIWDIQKVISKARTVIGYNVGFDIDFLEQFGISFQHIRNVVDVMQDYEETRINGRWQKLAHCAASLGFDWSKCQAHDSLGDCLATLHCYNVLEKKELPTP